MCSFSYSRHSTCGLVMERSTPLSVFSVHEYHCSDTTLWEWYCLCEHSRWFSQECGTWARRSFKNTLVLSKDNKDIDEQLYSVYERICVSLTPEMWATCSHAREIVHYCGVCFSLEECLWVSENLSRRRVLSLAREKKNRSSVRFNMYTSGLCKLQVCSEKSLKFDISQPTVIYFTF